MSLEFQASGNRSVFATPTPLGADARVVHPLKTHIERQDERTIALSHARVMYGAGLAMRLATEDAMGAEVARLPGLPSSYLLHETLRGDHERIGFAEILNVPHERPEVPKISLHERAERKFAISDPSDAVNDERVHA